MSRLTKTQQSTLGLTALICLLTLVTELAEYRLFADIQTKEKSSAFDNLTSVGQLKASQLANFIKERQGDSLVLTDMLKLGLPQRWWANKSRPDLPAPLLHPLTSAMAYYGYAGVIILDAAGQIRFRTSDAMDLPESLTSAALQGDQMPRSPGSHLYAIGTDQPRLDTFAPIMSSDNATVVGAMVLRGYWPNLFAMIQSWPVESRTAETLLVSIESTRVTLLNELRHKVPSPLRPHEPIAVGPDSPPWPIIKAARGLHGPVETSDYRGQAVLAFILPVQGTPWNMVVKVDVEEALGDIQRLYQIAAAGTVIAAVCLGLLTHRWQRRREQHRTLRETHELEHRLATIIDSAMDAIISIDKNQRIVLFNPTAEQIFRCSAHEAIGQPLDRFIPARFHESMRQQLHAFGPGGASTWKMGALEFALGMRSDGQEFPFEASLTETRTDGQALYTIILRDITDRLHAEQTLRTSEARLNEAQRLAQIGSWELDLTTLSLIWSAEIFRIFEINPTEFDASYEAFLNLIHPEDRDLVNNAYRTSVETRTPYNISHRLLMADGRVKYVQEHCETFYDETTGKPLRSIGTVQDSTALKEAELALTQSEVLFRTLATIAPVGIFRTDATGTCLYVNDRWSEITGLNADRAAKLGWTTALHENDRGRISDEWAHAIQNHKPFHAEYRFCTATGAVTWVVGQAQAERDQHGRVTGYVGTITDITERKLHELHVEESLQEKETLLREVHHRVKNNLQIISSLFHFQMKKAQPGVELAALRDGQDRLSAMILVHELLYRSTDLHRIPLNRYIANLTEQLQRSFRVAATRIRLTVKTDDIRIPVAIALPCGMIVTELVTNAFKYAYPPGASGPVSVRLIRGESSFHLSVSDEGVGLPATFDIAKSNSFGLTLVNKLANQLHATLTRQPGSGTTIVLDIPFPAKTAGPEDQEDTPPQPTGERNSYA